MDWCLPVVKAGGRGERQGMSVYKDNLRHPCGDGMFLYLDCISCQSPGCDIVL